MLECESVYFLITIKRGQILMSLLISMFNNNNRVSSNNNYIISYARYRDHYSIITHISIILYELIISNDNNYSIVSSNVIVDCYITIIIIIKQLLSSYYVCDIVIGIIDILMLIK